MAAPTFTSITPDTGHPGGGYLVEIVGGDFQMPPDPPATGYVGGDPEASFEVEINGRLATEVKVYSATLATCIVPAYRGAPGDLGTGLPVDLVLRNLGPPAEELAVEDAFTYQRRSLARSTGVLMRVVRALIQDMQRQIIQNISIQTDLDYDAETGDFLDIIEVVEPPGIALFGPRITENKERREPIKQVESDIDTLTYAKYCEAKVVDLAFDATLVTQGNGAFSELLNLAQEFSLFFHRNAHLEVNRDLTDPDAGTVELELWLTSEPSPESLVNTSGSKAMAATFEIRAVPLDWDLSLLVESGMMLDDPPDVELTSEAIEE